MPEFVNVTENIYLLKIPFGKLWTGVVLITGDENFLIDSGCSEPEEYIIPALEKMGLKISDIDYLLNTHCHGDHITGHFGLKEKYGIKTVTFEGGKDALLNPAENAVRIRTRFPGHSPQPQSWLRGALADVTLSDGQPFGGRLRLIHTPGHDYDCVCWYDIPTKTIICGDSLQGGGTPAQGVGFYQSLEDYRKSLEKLRLYDIENIILGHEYDGIGCVVKGRDNSLRCLDFCDEITYKYHNLIKKYLNEGLTDDAEIAVRLISDTGCGMPEKLFLALYTVNEHLKEMEI